MIGEENGGARWVFQPRRFLVNAWEEGGEMGLLLRVVFGFMFGWRGQRCGLPVVVYFTSGDGAVSDRVLGRDGFHFYGCNREVDWICIPWGHKAFGLGD